MQFAHVKAVRILADWCSNGLWSVPSIPGSSIEGLRLRPDLYDRLQRWVDWYVKLDIIRERSHWTEGDFTDFNIEGYAIAFAVKADHPDWRVFYVDETLFDLNIRLSVPIEIPDRVT